MLAGLALAAESLGLDTAGAARRHHPHRPRHHRRHQRAAGGQGRPRRHAHHRRPPRHHRNARGPEARPLQPAHGAARPAGAAPPAPAGARAHPRRRQHRNAAGPGVAGCRDRSSLRRRACRRWRSASCTPGATRRTSRAAAEAARARLQQAYVTASSDVLPQIKEFERFSTTVANAAVGPVIQNYLGRLQDRLGEAGFRGELLVILSHGGVASVPEAIRLAAGTALSGPAGGVAAAVALARAGVARDLIAFDMGGTSTDIALVRDGRADTRRRQDGGQRADCAARAGYRDARCRRRLDRAGGPRGVAGGGAGECGSRSGPRLLRPGRNCGHGDGRKPGAGLSRSGELPWRPAPVGRGSGDGGGAGGGRWAGAVGRASRVRHPPPGEHPHGGRRARRHRAPRRRSARLRLARVRRRGGPARDGRGGGVGDRPRRRAGGCVGAIRLGDAEHRPAHRADAQPAADRRHRCGRAEGRLRGDGAGGAGAAVMVRRAGLGVALCRHEVWRAGI